MLTAGETCNATLRHPGRKSARLRVRAVDENLKTEPT